MPFDHDEVVKAQFQQLAAARAKALGDYESARISDDGEATMQAADAILEADARLNALDRVARNLHRERQPAPMAGEDDLSHRDVALARKYGLSASEIGIAKGWTSTPGLTDEQKTAHYVEQRQRYQQARRDGTYRDDQGVQRNKF
jgi:hypothetical protein